MSLSGKVAIVTGAGTGIGKGTAIELAKRGAKVAVHYNSSDAGALDTKKQIEDLGGTAITVQANVSQKDQIVRMVKQVYDHFGQIDILFNNAALQLNQRFYEYTSENYDKMMHTNLKGYWLCIQAVVPYMKKQKSGRIIINSSVHSKRPTDFDAVYSMTKGGIRMLAREAAAELGKYFITVNCIEPGAIDVGKQPVRASEEVFYSEEERNRAKKIPKDRFMLKFPMGRVGTPAEVGTLVSYIASDETQFLSGAAIRLDGSSMLL